MGSGLHRRSEILGFANDGSPSRILTQDFGAVAAPNMPDAPKRGRPVRVIPQLG